jgi:branched-chain amino acid transport system substrate-binding protein
MKLKLATLALAGVLAAGPVLAENVVTSLSYRTGPYAANGIPVADGFADYITLLNERDGGVGGVPVKMIECETGYNTEKGVECYEATKGEGALVYSPLSTGITYQLIPKASADGIPVHSMGYGRTSAANGKVFEWIFNYPATYWDGASIAINHIMDLNGGDISGKKIALVYHNSAYGKEPIRTLEVLAEKHGYELSLLPVDHPGQEQKSQWLQIRRERPDYVLMWGWGVMNQVAIQEAANIRFNMENFIGVWWSGSENDTLPAGAGADGYKALTLANPGSDYPIYGDLAQYVYDTGKAAGAGDQHGYVLYNRGLYQAFLTTEAIRKAQEMFGVSDITPAQMRDAMEALEITDELMAAAGLPDFAPAFSVSCENHGGSGMAKIQQWDADSQTWSVITDWISADRSVVDPLIAEDSAAYAAEAGISERCG